MKRISKFFKNFWMVVSRPEMLILPGHLAFFFILSVVPILTLISYGASRLNLSISFITEFITKAFGTSVSDMIMPTVSNNQISLSFIVTLITGYYVASKGASSIIITSNMIYGIEDKGWIYRKIKSLIMTIFIVILFLFILIVPLFGDSIINALRYVNMNSVITDRIETIFNILQGPISWLIIFFFIKIIYTMAPDKKIPSKNVNYGALFTSILWLVVTALYSGYINKFANYSILYGGLANLIVLLLWFYFLANVFVIGMALNYRKDEEKLNETMNILINKMEETGSIKNTKKDNNKIEINK